MKTYPLKIENVGEDDYILMSKGHHPLKEFMEACHKAYPNWPMGKPEHLWFKAIPKDGYACWYALADKNTRGAFPATYVREGYEE